MNLVLALTLAAQYIYPAYSPQFQVNKPGEVYDIALCVDAANVSTDRGRPGCRYFEGTVTVWVESIHEDRVQVTWNDQTYYTVTTRVLLNCRGMSTKMTGFWDDERQTYRFDLC